MFKVFENPGLNPGILEFGNHSGSDGPNPGNLVHIFIIKEPQLVQQI